MGTHGHNVFISLNGSDTNILSHFRSTVFYRTTFGDLDTLVSQLNNKILSYVFVVENIEDYNASLASLVHSHVYSSYSTFLMVTNSLGVLDDLAKILWSFKLLRSYMIVISQEYIKAFKVEVINCGTEAKAKEIVSFVDAKCNLNKLQINLKETLQGCPLHIITGYQPPFVNPPNETLNGMFIDILDVMGKISQRSIVIRPYDGIYMEEIIQSYSFNAMIEDFESGYADIFLGSIQVAEMEVIDISPILASNDLMFLIPRKLISDPIELMFTTTIHMSLPLLLFAIVSLAAIFMWMMQRTTDKNLFRNFWKVCFYFTGMTVNVASLSTVPQSSTARVFLAWFFALVMVSTTYLQGVFISVLNGPVYEPPLKNLGQLIQRDIPIKLFPTLAFFFQYTGNEYYSEIYDKHIPLREFDLFIVGNTLLKERNFAAVIYEGFLIMRPNLQKSFSIIGFYRNSFHAGMPKNYFMHKEFSQWFTDIVEYGITSKFLKLYKFSYALEYYRSQNGSERVCQLTFDQVEPVLYLLGAGFLCAFILCLSEIAVYHFRKHWKSRLVLISSRRLAKNN